MGFAATAMLSLALSLSRSLALFERKRPLASRRVRPLLALPIQKIEDILKPAVLAQSSSPDPEISGDFFSRLPETETPVSFKVSSIPNNGLCVRRRTRQQAARRR